MTKLISTVLMWMAFIPLSLAERIALDSPVIDAKQNFKEGVIEFVGVQWEGKLLLPGVAVDRQAQVREEHSIKILNPEWQSPEDLGYLKGKEYQIKRYANRYNLMMEKLIKQDKLEKAQRYRY